MTESLPSVFVSHGAPSLPLEETPARGFLEGLGGELGRPEAVLCVSAHWETAAPALSLAASPETIHDFFGFPEALYRLRYPAPGAPDLARRAAALLGAAGQEASLVEDRGLDHGAWIPLMLMYADAGVPVTQLSVLTGDGPTAHLALGRALAPLRAEGVLILGSGGARCTTCANGTLATPRCRPGPRPSTTGWRRASRRVPWTIWPPTGRAIPRAPGPIRARSISCRS